LTAIQDFLDWAYIASATPGGAAPRRSASAGGSLGASPAATGAAGVFLSSVGTDETGGSAALIAALNLLFTEWRAGADLHRFSSVPEPSTVSPRFGDWGEA